MAGGGVKRAMAYGVTDDLGYEAVRDPVHIHDWHATLLHSLGLDHKQLTFNYAGRDFRLTDIYGKVVHEVIDASDRTHSDKICHSPEKSSVHNRIGSSSPQAAK